MKWMLVITAIGTADQGSMNLQADFETLGDCEASRVVVTPHFKDIYPFVMSKCTPKQEADQ